ncbi:DUF3394 domain-containing protein [Xenorhabdus budapestensis]|uniref:C4-dicarboxylate ABC transporter permease n=1 Tax=Xenorhabdus budapestensis TaxID=290110 RepID=A0A2D0J0M5_XENBU|nr:DUF3394 domain-containing protein [Xenorhabdus budapestensis]PHM27795.1 C4-dicarboxylate ABC transporter permease [Xenorhabdus budapestensis]QTL38455.1 DUF3394 domain-containing protein [Xenorhabdus budapestensis]
MQGSDLNVLSILYMIMMALIGIYSLSIATSNFWMIKVHWLERVLFTIAAILLIKPDIWTDLAGRMPIVLSGGIHLLRYKHYRTVLRDNSSKHDLGAN